MEPSSYIENEDPSVFPHSEFTQARDVEEREMQEEYQAEQKEIEDGVSVLGICIYLLPPRVLNIVKLLILYRFYNCQTIYFRLIED